MAKRGLWPQFLLISSKYDRLFSSKSSSTSNQLFKRLIEEPKSRVKSLLYSQDTFDINGGLEFSWETLISCLRSSSPDKAQLVLEWRLEKLLQKDVRDHDPYIELISLCGKIRNVPLAMHVFTMMEAHGIKPTSAVLNSLIHACLSSGNVTAAHSLFEIMESSQGFKPNSCTYNAFMLAFANLGNLDSTQAWYSAKKAAGFSADLQTYESLISCCVKSRNYETADRLYEEMMISGLTPNMNILEHMSEGLCQQRNLDRVKELLKSVLDGESKINENMAEKLVGLYIELGRVEEIEELLVTFVKSNQDPEVLSYMHRGIIRMYATSDRLDDVEYAVGRMLKQGFSFKRPDEVEKVICSYFRRAAYDRLDLFLEHIKGSYKLVRSTYDLLIAGYRRAGLSDKLDMMIKHMELAGF